MIVLRGQFGNGVDRVIWTEERDPARVQFLVDLYHLELGKVHWEEDKRNSLMLCYVLIQWKEGVV